MPRVLVCLDPQPNPDGSCEQSAWIEQPSIADMLPTVDEANAVGFALFSGLIVLAAMSLLLPPREQYE